MSYLMHDEGVIGKRSVQVTLSIHPGLVTRKSHLLKSSYQYQGVTRSCSSEFLDCISGDIEVHFCGSPLR